MTDGAEFASSGNEKSATGGRGKLAGAGRSRGRDLAEWVLAYGLILMVIWTPRPLQRVLWMVAVVALALMIVLSVKVDRLGLDEPGRGWLDAMGLRRKNLGRSLWVAGLALAMAGTAIGVAARMGTLHTPHGLWDFVRSYWGYALWSFVQQFLMLGFFLTRLRRLLRSARVAAVATALIFALAHIPNPILTPLTLVWGLCACMLFLHYRNLYPLAVAHAVLGITVAIAIPGPVVHNMRVGLGYLTYRYRPHVRAPMGVVK